ncbi:MAG: hypothetical protein U1A27_14510 [Phycisphaerae bacterium]
MLDPAARHHPYLFEHHPEANLWSFRRTLFGSWRPRRFWTTLHPAQPSRPRRLLAYALVILGTALFAWGGLMVGSLATCAQIIAQRDAADRAYLLAFYSGPQTPPERQRWIISQYGSIANYINTFSPSVSFWTMMRGWRGLRLDAPIRVLLWSVLWPLVTFAALLVFQQSMRRAKVAASTSGRCIAYCLDATVVLGLLISAAVFIGDNLSIWPTLLSVGVSQLLLFIGIPLSLMITGAVWFGYRLICAYRRYLRFQHAVATIIAAQLVTGMVFLNLDLLISLR